MKLLRIQVKNIHGPVLSNINLTLYVYMDISWNIWLELIISSWTVLPSLALSMRKTTQLC